MRCFLTALCLIAVATLAHADAPDDHSMVVIASKYTNFVAGGNDTYEFSVEFADTGHTESLTLTTYGSAGGTVEVFIVIDDVAMLQHSQLLDGSGEAQINDLAIFVEGTVGFRVVVDANSSGDVFWSMSQPRADADFAESTHRSGRGHCSTGDSQNSLFAILGVMAVLGAASIVVTRRRA